MKGTTGAKRHAIKKRKDDLYETHPVATLALLRHEEVPDVIWEPCCGPGAIVKVLRDTGRMVYATDLVDYRTTHGSSYQDESGWDFLMENQLPLGAKAIITNPPFKYAAQIAQRALTMTPKVFMLLRLAFLEAGNEKNDDGRARLSVLDGGNLKRVLVFRNRLPMMHRDGWNGPMMTNSTAYAWFVWDGDYKGPTEVKRITWTREGLDERRGDAEQPRRRKRAARGDPSQERRFL